MPREAARNAPLRLPWRRAGLILLAAALLAWTLRDRLVPGDPLTAAVQAAREAPADLGRRWRAVDLALGAGRPDLALELLEIRPEPVDLAGREGDWQRLRARVLEAAGRLDDAAAAAWRATELGSTRGETWRDLGLLLYRWFREELPRARRAPGLARLLGDARFALATAARFAPADPAVWLTLGRIHATFGDAARAREALERVLAMRPPPPEARRAGMARLLLDEARPWPEAVAAAEKLAARGGAAGWQELGGLCLDFFYDGVWQSGAGHRPLAEEARRCFRRAVAAAPEDAASWYRLGLAAANLGDRKEAGEAFRRAREAAPGSRLAALAAHSLEVLEGGGPAAGGG